MIKIINVITKITKWKKFFLGHQSLFEVIYCSKEKWNWEKRMFDKEWTNRSGMNHQPTCAVHRWFHKTESWFVKLPLRCYPFSQKNTFPNPAVFDFFDLIFTLILIFIFHLFFLNEFIVKFIWYTLLFLTQNLRKLKLQFLYTNFINVSFFFANHYQGRSRIF